MENIIKTSKGILMSKATKENTNDLFKDVVGVFMKDPVAAWSTVKDIRSLPSAIRDGIFMECLQVVLLNAYPYDYERREFIGSNLKALAVELAEASPNEEADYKGDDEQLVEYSKRLVKLIDDCGTIQKAFYLSCLTRALINKEIDTGKYFKLSRCVINLTEEDLNFLCKHISPNIVKDDEEYIDEYKALGLLKDVDGGFEYTRKAYELKKYALDYEGNVIIPESFSARALPQVIESISNEEIDAMFEKNKSEIIEEATEKSKLKWEEF